MRVINRTDSQVLVNGPLSALFDFDNPGRLLTVYVSLSVVVIEDIQINYISKEGPEFDCCIASYTLNDSEENEQKYIYAAEGHVAFNEGDRLEVTCSNAQATGEVFVTAKLETDY